MLSVRSDLSLSQGGRERRGHIEIVYSIINLAQNGESEYKIKEKVCVNHRQVKSYLEELTELGLIEVKFRKGKKVYVTSQTGNQFLKQYHLLCSLVGQRAHFL